MMFHDLDPKDKVWVLGELVMVMTLIIGDIFLFWCMVH